MRQPPLRCHDNKPLATILLPTWTTTAARGEATKAAVGADAPTTKPKISANNQKITMYAPPLANTLHPHVPPRHHDDLQGKSN